MRARAASRIVAAFATTTSFLFAPSDAISDLAERRKARLAAIFLFVQAVLLTVSSMIVWHMDRGPAGPAIASVLGAAGVLVTLTWTGSRTRHVGLAVWAAIAVLIAIPIVMTFATRGLDAKPFESIAYLVTTILFASVTLSKRGMMFVALLGGICAVEIGRLGPPEWAADVRDGIQFVVVHAALILAFRVHRDGVEADRSAELLARNTELEGLRRTLEGRIAERTAELTSRNAAMRLVLDNLQEGLFIIGADGTIAPPYSQVLVGWFGAPESGERFYDYLARVSAPFGERAAFAWSQLQADVLPLSAALEQLPASIEAGGRSYRVGYQPIGTGAIEDYLVVISDVTAEIERGRMQIEKTETLSLFEHMLADRSGFRQFIGEASAMVALLSSAHGGAPSELKRTLHTLKGNASVAGLFSIATLCHEIESSIEESGKPQDADLATLSERWASIARDVERLLGARKQVVEMSLVEYQTLARAASPSGSFEEVRAIVAALELEPAERRLRHHAAQLARIAERADKQVKVEISHDGLRLDASRWAPFWSAMVHPIRNAVAHGIEYPDERRAAGKPEVGLVTLRARRDGQDVVVEVEDDGRGVDWSAIKQRAESLGLPAATENDLVRALSHGGVSTVTVTELSGRGVGMAALREAVMDLGGELDIESETGRGTLLRMRFPGSAVRGAIRSAA